MTDSSRHEKFVLALEASQRRIVEHPGYIEKELIDGLSRTVYAVLIPNRDELLGLLDRAASDVGLAVELFQNIRRPVARTRFEGAVMRALLNYVASASALVDHSRRILRGRSGPIIDKFEQQKEALIANPEVPFVHDLRNFVLHHALPFVGNEVRIEPAPGVLATSEIKLSTHDLKKSKKWSRGARDFIESHGDELPLRPVIQSHSDLVIALNLWLYEQLADANAPAVAELNELVVERNAILGNTDMTEARRVTEAWTKVQESPTLDPNLDLKSLFPRSRPDGASQPLERRGSQLGPSYCLYSHQIGFCESARLPRLISAASHLLMRIC